MSKFRCLYCAMRLSALYACPVHYGLCDACCNCAPESSKLLRKEAHEFAEWRITNRGYAVIAIAILLAMVLILWVTRDHGFIGWRWVRISEYIKHMPAPTPSYDGTYELP